MSTVCMPVINLYHRHIIKYYSIHPLFPLESVCRNLPTNFLVLAALSSFVLSRGKWCTCIQNSDVEKSILWKFIFYGHHKRTKWSPQIDQGRIRETSSLVTKEQEYKILSSVWRPTSKFNKIAMSLKSGFNSVWVNVFVRYNADKEG